MSGISSVSKSIEGTALNLPKDSFTAASSICHIAGSFSNLISVFVGCMFTSIFDGSTSKYIKYDTCSPVGIRCSYASMTALWKYGWRIYLPLTKKNCLAPFFLADSGLPMKPEIFIIVVLTSIENSSWLIFLPNTPIILWRN